MATIPQLLESKLVLAAYEHYCAALDDPYRFTGTCETMLLGCYTTWLHGVEHLTGYPWSYDIGHRILGLYMAFLSAPRTQNQFMDLRHRLTCHCEDIHPLQPSQVFEYMMHRRGNERGGPTVMNGETHFDTLLHLFVEMLDTSILQSEPLQGGISLYKVSRRLRKHHRSKKLAKLWPEHPLHLVPHGAEDSIRGLLAWIDSPKAQLLLPMMSLVSHILEACNKLFVIYVVTADKFWSHVISYIMQRSTTWYSVVGDGHYSTETCIKTLNELYTFSELFAAVLLCADPTLFHYFVEGDNSGLRDCRIMLTMFNTILAWFRHYEKACASLSMDQQKRVAEARQTFILLESHVFAFFEDARLPPELTVDHDMILSGAKVLRALHDDPVKAAFRAMLELYQNQRCAAPDCTVTYQEWGRKFKHCAGCGRTPYCSITCQRRAWRHHLLPHKSICHLVYVVAENGMLGRRVNISDMDVFVDAYRSEELCQPRNMRVLKAVIDHTRALYRAKMSLPGMWPQI